MAKNNDVVLSFDTKQSQQEIKNLTNLMKNTEKEFKKTDEVLKVMGTSSSVLANKTKYLSQEFETQKKITAKTKETFDAYKNSQKALYEELSRSTKAYDSYNNAGEKDEKTLKKLNSEMEKAQKAYDNNISSISSYTGKLTDSERAQNKLEVAVKKTTKEMVNQKLNSFTKSLDKISSVASKAGIGLTVGVTAPIVLLGKEALAAASNLVEAQNIVDQSFKKGSESINIWSQNLLDSYGISELTAKQTSGMFKAMANGAKIVDNAGTKMSKTLTSLTADFSSFYNVSLEESKTALSSVFTGETESLKRYGIVMTDVNLQAFAMSQGIEKNTKDMDAAEKVTLRYNFMLDQLNIVTGDFSRTVGTSLANQTRLAQERFKSMSADLARELLPVALDLLK